VARLIVLLRGVNLVRTNRIAMPALREALADAGFDDVRTYVQSGNVVLTSGASPKSVAVEVERVVEERFGLDVGIVVRTRAELARVVARNPLAEVATDPRRLQVTFLDARPRKAVVDELASLAVPPEELVHAGRELYAWHPNGIGRSKLAARLAGRSLGVTATARNWSTVTKLLELSEE
jgi:uncharacterized protein (DUF1697 family)